MKQIGYISVYSTINKIYRDLGIDDISEADSIEWAAEAVEHMSIKENYIYNTAFLNVENYHCELPQNVINVLQIAVHTFINERPKLPKAIAVEVENDVCGCNTREVECGCEEHEESDPHLIFCSSFMQNYGIVFNINAIGRHRNEWIEVEPTGNNYFSSNLCDVQGNSRGLQYRISNGKILFSFEKGFIAMSYITMAKDENGYPMIPDDVSAREAVAKYITMKIMTRQWYKGREGFQDKMTKAEQDWHWYLKQYKNKMKMPDAEEYRKLLRQELRMFPVYTPDSYGEIRADMLISDIYIMH